MRTALVTGYKDFSQVPNPSRLLVERLAADSELAGRLDVERLVYKVLSVDDKGMADFCGLLERYSPELVLSFGQGGPGSTNDLDRGSEYGRPVIECFARNAFQDFGAGREGRLAIFEEEPKGAEYVHPHIGFFREREEGRVRVNLEHDGRRFNRGGRYFCNMLNAYLMKYLRREPGAKGFFCHLPMFANENLGMAGEVLADTRVRSFFGGTIEGVDRDQWMTRVDEVHRGFDLEVDKKNIMELVEAYVSHDWADLS